MRPARRPSFRPDRYRGLAPDVQDELQTEANVQERIGVINPEEAPTVVLPDKRIEFTPHPVVEEAPTEIEITPIDPNSLELISAEDEIDTVVISNERQEEIVPRAPQLYVGEQPTAPIRSLNLNETPEYGEHHDDQVSGLEYKSPTQYAKVADQLASQPRIERRSSVAGWQTAEQRRTPEQRALEAQQRAQDVYSQQRVNSSSNATIEVQRGNEQRLDAALGVYEQFTKAATELRRSFDETRWTSPISKAYSWVLWRNTQRNMDKYRKAYPEMVRMINSGKRSKGLSRRLAQQQYNAERAHEERLKR